MDVVFFGTPDFALPTLAALASKHEVKAVVTQPAKPRGRRLKISPSAVKDWAGQHNIPILEPEQLRDPNLLNSIKELRPDVNVVAAYGRIIPRELLDIPRLGSINVHASLLPRYRGAAPIQRAIMDDMDKTGVTIMQMDEGMDTGDILSQGETLIEPGDNAALLTARLAEMGAELLIETLASLEAGQAQPIKQDESQATLAPPIAKEELSIDWSLPAARIVNLIRALDPAPGAHTAWRGRRLKIFKARDVPHGTPTGRFEIFDETLLVGTGQDAIEVLLLQPEGKKVMGAAEFIRGYRPKTGENVGAQ